MSYNTSWDAVFNPGKARDFFQIDKLQPFNGGISSFSPTNGWWLAELCRLIYVRGSHDPETEYQTNLRNRYLHTVGLEEYWFYNGRYVQCALVRPLEERGDSYTVLVFRGARKGVFNWLFTLNLLLSPWPAGGQVHRGFKKVLLDAWAEIEPRLREIASPLFYTGHSLGGALAVLAATLRKPSAVYTFGSPRLADAAFVKAVHHLQIHRVVNDRDIVVGVPPFAGIKHVGEPYFLQDKVYVNNRSFLRSAPYFLSDHSPVNYSLRLR